MNTFTVTAIIDGVPTQFVATRDPRTLDDGEVAAIAFNSLYAWQDEYGGDITSIGYAWSE